MTYETERDREIGGFYLQKPEKRGSRKREGKGGNKKVGLTLLDTTTMSLDKKILSLPKNAARAINQPVITVKALSRRGGTLVKSCDARGPAGGYGPRFSPS